MPPLCVRVCVRVCECVGKGGEACVSVSLKKEAAVTVGLHTVEAPYELYIYICILMSYTYICR